MTALLALAALMNIAEGLPAHLESAANMRLAKNTFDAKLLSDDLKEVISKINPKDYQAIIALPFYHQGSENFSRPVSEPILSNSILFSYHTGLPLVNANLTRLSIKESKNCIALIGPGTYKKEIEQDLVDTRPFLLLVCPNGLNRYEQDLIGKAQILIQKKVIACYVLNKERLFEHNQKLSFGQTYVYAIDTQKVNRPAGLIYQNCFENISATRTYRGKGAFSAPKVGSHTIDEIAPGHFHSGANCTFALWMYNDEQDQLNDWLRVVIEERDKSDQLIQETAFFPEQSACIDGSWSLVEGAFQVKSEHNHIVILTKGKETTKNLLYADELMIFDRQDTAAQAN